MTTNEDPPDSPPQAEIPMSHRSENDPNHMMKGDNDVENPGRGRMVSSGDSNDDNDDGRPVGQKRAADEAAGNNTIRSDDGNTTDNARIDSLVAGMANILPNDALAVDDTVRVTNRQYSRDSGSFVELVEDDTDDVDARNVAQNDYYQRHPLGRIHEASNAAARASSAQTESYPSYSRESTGYSSETVPSTNHAVDQVPTPTGLADVPVPSIGLVSATKPIRVVVDPGNDNSNTNTSDNNRSRGKSSRNYALEKQVTETTRNSSNNNRSQGRSTRTYALEKQTTESTVHRRNTSKDKSKFNFFLTDLNLDVPEGDVHPLKRPSPRESPNTTQHEQDRKQRQLSSQTGNNSQKSVDESPFVQPLLSLFQDPSITSNKASGESESVQHDNTSNNVGSLPRQVGNPDVLDSPHMKMVSVIQFPNPQPSRHYPPPGRGVSFDGSLGGHHHDTSSVGSSLGDPIDDGHTTDGEQNENSRKSLDSHIFRTAAMAIPTLALSDREDLRKSVRAAGRTVHQSNRMVSLTRDMETGRTGTRGQHAMMRGTTFAEAQSPRLRRRRGWSKSLENVRRRLISKLWMPNIGSTHGARSDIHDPSFSDDGSAIVNSTQKEKSTGVHGRLYVKKQSVMVDDEPIQNEVTGQIETTKTQHEEKQYRLSAITTANLRRRRGANQGGSERRHFLSKWQSNLYEETTTQDNSGLMCCFAKPNQLVHGYLFWAFRNSFALVFLSAAGLFYFFTIFFALVLYLLGLAQPNCIHVNGEDFGLSKDPFMDAYALSWTTFTTVGYGLVFPATSATVMNSRACMGISILTTLEAFVGILFSSFWGAIFFSKISRVSSHAQVTFSDAMIVKYGIGVSGLPDGKKDDEDDENSSEEEPESFLLPAVANIASNSDTVNSAPGTVFGLHSPPVRPFRYKKSKWPCPFLEFRIVNDLFEQRGGEIIDATLNIVASMDESQVALAVKKAAQGSNKNAASRNQKRRRKRGKLRPVIGSGGMFDEDIEGAVDPTDESSIKKLQESVKNMVVAHNKAWALDLDPSGKFLPRRIFCKLDFESQEHPFFKRIWQVRHVLDHNSPLLKQEAKEMVRLNGGHWPDELNNAEGVRASIHFDQILVSLSGTSNVDANPVYAQKVYDFVDICVGYSFCNMLFRDNDGGIQVDPYLLNDVKEQEGGGGEQLDMMDSNKNDDIFIL